MTCPDSFHGDRRPPKNIFLGWLDHYIYVDRLNIRRADILPQMRWWEWVWYVVVVVVGSHFALVLYDLLDSWLQRVPILRWFSFLVLWLPVSLFSALVYRYLLPAWSSRQTLKGEGWLIGALALASTFIFPLT